MQHSFVRVAALSFLLFCSAFSLQAQDWNVARLSILSGGTVDFLFNSFDKYENGIVATDATTLGVTVANLADGSALASWTIDVTTNLGQTDIEGDGANTLPLSTLELTSSANLGLATNTTFFGPLALSTATQTLVSSTLTTTDWTTDQVNITYDCGTTTALIEETPGYYSVEIEFTLTPGF